jgi:hypothetical protein
MKVTHSTVFLVLFLVLFVFTGGVFAEAGHAKPPCGTYGPLGMTTLSTSSYSYEMTESGSVSGSFTVSSPPLNINPSCNSNLPNVYGNGDPGSTIEIIVRITDITNSATGDPVDDPTAQAIKNAFSFDPADFILDSPGTGRQVVNFTFTNNNSISAGGYDINIQAKPAKEADGTEGNEGVGTANTFFTLTVTDPQTCDTEAPTVTISSPTSNEHILMNGTLSVDFTAVDPTQGGAGTGITDISASIMSCSGNWNYPVSLTVIPVLPVSAGQTVEATANISDLEIGNYTLIANAWDNAASTCAVADNIGSASVNFSVGANVAALPPISVHGKTFKTGSTVPIKWSITGAKGAFLPLFPSATVSITGPVTYSTAIGSGNANIRYNLDADGDVTQYLTNYKAPYAGTYTVRVYVNDVCGQPFSLGSFTFTATN